MIYFSRKFIVFLALFVTYSSVESQDLSDEKDELISELLELQGLNYIGNEYAQSIAEQLSLNLANTGIEIDAEFYEALVQITSEIFFEELVYSGELQRFFGGLFKKFDDDELRSVIEFYKSDVGSKISGIDVNQSFFESDEFADINKTIFDEIRVRLLAKSEELGFEADSFFDANINDEYANEGPSEAEIESLVHEACANIEPSKKALPVYRASPRYPAVALDHSVTGWVELAFNVNEEARTANISVTNTSTGTLFNASAIEAVKGYRYCPGREPGTEAVRVRFKLKDDDKLTRTHPAVRSLSASNGKEFGFVATQKFLDVLNAYAKRRSRKALSIVYEGGRWSSYTSYGYRTIEDASLSALKNCNELRNDRGFTSECEVFLVGHQLVGDFKKVPLLNDITNSLHDKDFEERSYFETSVNEYLEGEGKKAMAIVEMNDGAYYFYRTFGWTEQIEANRDALSKCQDNKPEKFKSDCRLYMRGNNLVDDESN